MAQRRVEINTNEQTGEVYIRLGGDKTDVGRISIFPDGDRFTVRASRGGDPEERERWTDAHRYL